MADVRTGTLDELGDDWSTLHAADAEATPFQSLRWLEVWQAHRAHDPVQLDLVDVDGQPAAGFARARREEQTWALAGGDDVTDYRGPIGAPPDHDAVASAWVEHLLERGDDGQGWQRLHLAGMRADLAWPDALAGAARAHELAVDHQDVAEVCPRVALDDGFDGWLESLDGKQRQELRRKARKLGRDLGGMQVVEASPDETEQAITRFLALAAQAEGDKGAFFRDEPMRRFFTGLAREFGHDRTLRVHELLVGDAPAAATVSLVWTAGRRREWSLYNSAFDPALSSFAPGLVLVFELLRLAAEQGCETFDLLRGGESYKYRLGATDRSLATLDIDR